MQASRCCEKVQAYVGAARRLLRSSSVVPVKVTVEFGCVALISELLRSSLCRCVRWRLCLSRFDPSR